MTTPNAVPVAVAGPEDANGASPLGLARDVVSGLAGELEAVVARLDAESREADDALLDLRERLDRADDVRRHVLRHLDRLQPRDVDDAFELLASMRAAVAVAEDRRVEMSRHRQQVARQLDGLRTVARSLEEAVLVDPSAAARLDGAAARFRDASRQLFQIIEEERTRVARDLHDGPAQCLASLVLQAEVLERLAGRDPAQLSGELVAFKGGVRRALEETRRLIFELRPMTLDDLGLVPTLRRLVRDVSDANGLNCRLHIVGEERRLPGHYEAVVFRIVQEALINVVKHARAETVEVVLTLQPGRVAALVRDDGEGFDVAATEARQGRTRSLGLISMRERADLEKGDLEVRSEIGRGTEVRVSFPV